MSISNQILGMNARNFLYIARYNKTGAKKRADDKLETKRLLLKHGISTPIILHSFITRKGINEFNWDLPSQGFAVKPARGYGGEGILVFEKWDNLNGEGITISGETYTVKQLKSHIFDIFDGIYSLQSLPDRAYIEERLLPHPFFKKLTPIGLPDIRVIVFNKIPIMAMLRLPSPESEGKANLHQGAIGIGIGLRTGITKHAVYKSKHIRYIPSSKIKTAGIKIPDWDEVLLLATRAQIASGLGYAGVDIVFDKKDGPVVIEINARPGLTIQNANLASLRSRLERVENLVVNTPERGVEISKSIFAEAFSDKVKTEPKVLSVIEDITITNNGKSKLYQAKLDTGAYRTSVDWSIVKELKLPILKGTIETVSANGKQSRMAVRIEFKLGGRKISSIATVTNRTHLTYPVIVGVQDLRGFYVNPSSASVPKVVIEEVEDSEYADLSE